MCRFVTLDEIGAEPVVMACHVPEIADQLHLVSASATCMVEHSDVALLVVR